MFSVGHVHSSGYAVISSVDVTKNGRWDTISKSAIYSFGTLAEWDTVTISQSGTSGMGFSKFYITCDNGKSIDFVKLYGCTHGIWFDPYDSGAQELHTANSCYKETASQVKTGTFGK